jgi:hypothetical protein
VDGAFAFGWKLPRPLPQAVLTREQFSVVKPQTKASESRQFGDGSL